MIPTGILNALKGLQIAAKLTSQGVRPMIKPVKAARDLTGLTDATKVMTRNLIQQKNWDGVFDLYRDVGVLGMQGSAKGANAKMFQGLSPRDRNNLLKEIKKISLASKPPQGITKRKVKDVFNYFEAEFGGSIPLDVRLPSDTAKIIKFRPKKAEGGLMSLMDLL
jgi:hypothetical protein